MRVESEIRFATGTCSLGAVLIAWSEQGVCAVLLGDDPRALEGDLQQHFPNSMLTGRRDADVRRLVARVEDFLESPHGMFDEPLDIWGTEFQKRVWQALREIPPGETASYSDIARRLGAPGSLRAVAQACAANRLAVVIPCHRVVRHEGALSGYRWGVDRKRALLAREAA
jgi:AraC family transcriptional regulator of adaptative response/methylated-DNA-[protein]-cysteine methyltransferase